MSNRCLVLASFGFGVFVLASATTATVWSKPKPPKPPKIETVTLDGTIETIGNKGFKVKAVKEKSGKKQGASKEWLIAPTSSTSWLVTGTANPSYLKTGQTIIFKAVLDDQDQPTDRISTLTLVSPVGNTPAVTADDGAGANQPKDQGIGAGVTATKVAKTDTTADPGTPKGKSKIVGKITLRNDTKLTVHAGGKVIRFELGENPTINVSMTDYTLIAAKAKVTIHGHATESRKVDLCQPDSVTITLTQPLTGKEKPIHLQPSSDKDEPAAMATDSDTSPGADAADADSKEATASDKAANDAESKGKPVADLAPKDPTVPEQK